MGGGDTQESTLHGSGQSVNVRVGPGFGLTVIACVGLAAILVLLLVSIRTASVATTKAEAAEAAAKSYAAELRMAQYWMQASYNSCTMQGVKMPAIPAQFIKR